MRVGIPHALEAEPADSRVCLQKLIRERQRELDQKRSWLEERSTATRNAPDIEHAGPVPIGAG